MIKIFRRFCIFLDRWSERLIVPEYLFRDISLNHNNPEKLKELKEKVKQLQQEYPFEPSFIKASALIERMLVIGK